MAQQWLVPILGRWGAFWKRFKMVNWDSCMLLSQKVTLPETNSLPLKIGRAPKGKYSLPTLHFQGLLLLVSGRVVMNGLLQITAKGYYWLCLLRNMDQGKYEQNTLCWKAISMIFSWDVTLFTGFFTSQVVQDFSHQQYYSWYFDGNLVIKPTSVFE